MTYRLRDEGNHGQAGRYVPADAVSYDGILALTPGEAERYLTFLDARAAETEHEAERSRIASALVTARTKHSKK